MKCLFSNVLKVFSALSLFICMVIVCIIHLSTLVKIQNDFYYYIPTQRSLHLTLSFGEGRGEVLPPKAILRVLHIVHLALQVFALKEVHIHFPEAPAQVKPYQLRIFQLVVVLHKIS